MAKHPKRRINLSVLPGDMEAIKRGAGRNCIHLFVEDDRGPYSEPHVLYPLLDAQGEPVKGQYEARATRGRIACDRRKIALPRQRAGTSVVDVTLRTNEARAVTCPKCQATPEYAEKMRLLEPSAEASTP